MNNVIELKDLSKYYKKSHLGRKTITLGVDNLNLTVRKGEIFGLVGLNGSGKTTTIKLLLGLLKPTNGSCRVLEKTVPSREVLRTIGYMPEVPYFYRYLTGTEILRLYGTMSDIPQVDKKVSEILKMVGLQDWKDKKLSDYSKGMLQRIALAQSLLHDPELLIYDEPVSGLDPMAIHEMRQLMLKLKSQGKTIFLSSHLISEIEKLCDRVAILAKGKLVRVLEKKDWDGTEGKLENLFISDVKDSSEMGRIQL